MMLYDTMKIDFIFQLSVFASFSLFFALLFIYNAHTSQRLLYKKWIVALFGLLSADFAILFIRVTAPYKSQSAFLLYSFIILTTITVAVSLICLTHYIKEKKSIKKALNIDILHYIDDYVLVFDNNGELVLSTCPKDLEKKVNFTKEETTFEVELNNECFTASLSPIMQKWHSPHYTEQVCEKKDTSCNSKNNMPIGAVGIFHNITSEKNILFTLSEKINRLSEINENLLHEVNIDDILLIAEQRKQLSIDIQEEINKKITILIKQIKELEEDVKIDIRMNNLALLADSLRLILTDIRKIVYGRSYK
jgi:hypothetical protein